MPWISGKMMRTPVARTALLVPVLSCMNTASEGTVSAGSVMKAKTCYIDLYPYLYQ